MARDAADDELLKPSPHFALELDFEGKPYMLSLAHPYDRVVNMTEPHRLLLGCFSGTGTSVHDAMRSFLRVHRLSSTAEHRRLVLRLVSALKAHRLLVPMDDPDTLYGANIAQDYLDHRAIPQEVVGAVVRAAHISRATRVLDLATGIGALANRLGEVSSHVTGMDLSKSFLRVAVRDATRRRVRVRYLHENANRLLRHSGRYDVVTISLALHWLDPGRASRGIYSVLKPGGRLVIIDGSIALPPRHPLASLLNGLGRFRADARARRHRALLAELGCPVRLENVFELDERRHIGIPFARAFLVPEILREYRVPGWQNPGRLWHTLESKLGDRTEAHWTGRFHWGCFTFRKGN